MAKEVEERENFISEKDADTFRNVMDNYFNLEDKRCFHHRTTQVIDCMYIHDIPEVDELGLKLKKLAKERNEKYTINYFQIVKWPEHSNQGEHIDFDYHPYSTILYLNDDFDGGETVVGDEIIYPKKCKLIGFEGNRITHKVNHITKGTRYTIPCWYKYESKF
tara:strand:- start:73 stop:561 length:489 start_codon:yes stop_codon:yes gene_type:complete